MLFKLKNHLVLFKLIDLHKNSSFISCDHYLSFNISYIVMTDCSKCAECIHHDYSCVDISLKFLNCTHKKLKFKLKLIIKEHAEHFITVVKLNAKLTKLFSQVKHNKLLFIFKIHCVTIKLNDDNNEMKNKNNFFNISQLVNSMSSFFWDLILFFSQNIETFSHSF